MSLLPGGNMQIVSTFAVTVQAHCTALAYFLGVRDERGVAFVEREKLVACLVDRRMPDGEIESLLAIVDEWADGEMVNVQQALHILRVSGEGDPLGG